MPETGGTAKCCLLLAMCGHNLPMCGMGRALHGLVFSHSAVCRYSSLIDVCCILMYVGVGIRQTAMQFTSAGCVAILCFHIFEFLGGLTASHDSICSDCGSIQHRCVPSSGMCRVRHIDASRAQHFRHRAFSVCRLLLAVTGTLLSWPWGQQRKCLSWTLLR